MSSRGTQTRVHLKLEQFRQVVQGNNRVLNLIADAGDKLSGEYIFDKQYLIDLAENLSRETRQVVSALNALTGERYSQLRSIAAAIREQLQAILQGHPPVPPSPPVLELERITAKDAAAVGSKMARLGELANALGATVPPGVVVSTGACRDFLASAGVLPLARVAEQGDKQLDKLAALLRQRILSARLPGKLRRALKRAAKVVAGATGSGLLAVRSSAVGEDGDISFAGQYHTELGVSPRAVAAAYQKVVSSLFAREVMEYRARHGLSPTDALMAVGILALVPARASGVVYTLDPRDPARDTLLVSATWGLGADLVSGQVPVDSWVVSRIPPHPVEQVTVAEKAEKLTVGERGVIQHRPLPVAMKSRPALENDELQQLAQLALRIERYLRCAQDIEWILDERGRFMVVQARPLRVSQTSRPQSVEVDTDRHPVILRNQGEVACRGVGCGPVWLAEGATAEPMPEQAVLVAPTASPRLAAYLPRAAAVVTDLGGSTGHLATVAREFRVPAVFDTQAATRLLEPGQVVTVDAEENIVYRGRVEALVKNQLLQLSAFEDKREFYLLRRLLHLVAPLNLTDPADANFIADNCRTYHDIIRYAHEQAVRELTGGRWLRSLRGGEPVYHLELDIPLDLVVIDLGEGVKTGTASRVIARGQVQCRPLQWLLATLESKGVWDTNPADMDMRGFLSSATRTDPLTSMVSAQPEQNVAIVSRDYLSLNLKLGYHYNLLECRATENNDDNYIYFRFAGGVTEFTRRSRRALLLRHILERLDFVVESSGDLVIGRMRKTSAGQMREKLDILGRLIGFTRQLDIHLRSDELVDRYVEKFFAANDNPEREPAPSKRWGGDYGGEGNGTGAGR